MPIAGRYNATKSFTVPFDGFLVGGGTNTTISINDTIVYDKGGTLNSGSNDRYYFVYRAVSEGDVVKYSNGSSAYSSCSFVVIKGDVTSQS